MKWIIILLSVTTIFLSTSCSIMSKKDCETADWSKKGYSDALKGKTLKDFSKNKKQCEGHGLAVDQEAYVKGRAKGLIKFCTYKSGYKFGRDGNEYKDTCPEKIETEFFKGYTIGKKEYELEQKEEELRNREMQLQAKQAMIAQHGSKSCSFNSDCKKDGDCSFGKCERSGKSCSFDSDCEIEGRCDSESEHVAGKWIEVNFCKYD